ncbi:MAG: maleylpyruvate isomerase family mycothiol-dependent enzyme [Streptosporangiaceae bacterium]
MGAELDYVDHLVRESARFAAAISEAPPEAPVPSCPDWNADDLLWHLAEVQWFWGTIVREGMTAVPEGQPTPQRPGDRAGLAAFYDRVSHDLADVLAATPPDTAAWTWAADHTVGFIRRRQAHEALIHRVDAELAADRRTPLDRDLSADGVDEALRIMYGNLPPWGSFTPDGVGTLRLRASDTGDTWLVTVGRFTGTDPGDGTRYDEPDIHAADSDPGDPAAAEISGTAADLDCWLWHRPTFAPVTSSGDHEVLSRFESAIAPGID